MNTKLTTEAKDDFEKEIFRIMNNSVFGKTMENVRKHREINFVTAEKRRRLQYQNQIITQQNGFQKMQ